MRNKSIKRNQVQLQKQLQFALLLVQQLSPLVEMDDWEKYGAGKMNNESNLLKISINK